jgi:hypothetical protein
MDHLGKDFSVSCPNHSGGGGLGFDDFTGIGSRNNKKRLVLEDELSADDLAFDVVDVLSEKPTFEEKADFSESDSSHPISCEYESAEADEKGSVESSSESDDDLNYSSSEEGEKDDGREDAASHSESESESDYSDSSSGSSESEVYAYIRDFPANLIFLEKCDGTLDRLFMDQKIDCDVGAACLMQVIMSLLAFQKAFHWSVFCCCCSLEKTSTPTELKLPILLSFFNWLRVLKSVPLWARTVS